MDVTLQHIADELDLSATTVSRSLRHDTTINPQTRARVNEAARRLGYKTRVRRPRRQVEHEPRTRTLGLLLRHSSLEAAHYDSNLMKMMAGIMTVTDENEMHLKVHTWFSREQSLAEGGSRIMTLIEEDECQALIVHGDHDADDLSFLVNRMSVVSMGRIFRDLPIDAAIGDNVEGVSGLVSHLVGLGHRRLAWVGGYYNATFMDERKTGFMKGCVTHDLELGDQVFFGREIYEKPEIRDTDALLRAVRSGVTGFVCGNDGIAMRVTKILEDASLHVPGDVSVTGFDAEPSTSSTRQPTSIDPGFFEIGKVATRLVLQRLAHPVGQPCTVSVRGKIALGDTTGPPRN